MFSQGSRTLNPMEPWRKRQDNPFGISAEMLGLWSGETLDWDSTASSPPRCLPRRSHHHHQRYGHHCGFSRLDKAPLDWNSVVWCERQLE
ncbi:unnamed protein product [Ectocarpus sp. 12 AP-2014]